MAFTERTDLRQTHSLTTQEGNTYRLTSSLAPLHYDNGGSMDRIDLSVNRVNNAQFDGWRATANGYHYALGQPAGKGDGWVGFGAKGGDHWIETRLHRVGYLFKPSGTPILADDFDPIGGAPDFDRANLTRTTETATIQGETINTGTQAEWRNLWTTPGGGELYAVWKAQGDRLKEEVTINQAGRDWIAANAPPTTPANNTWFGFVFQVDWPAGIKRYVNNVEQTGDIEDDTYGVELRSATEEFLAFMPLDRVFIPTIDETEDFDSVKPLTKKFWQDNDGNYYIMVGIKVNQLNQMPAGDLIFDPTINAQVGAGADDGRWQKKIGFDYFSSSETCIQWGRTTNDYNNIDFWARFTGIQFTGTPTITTADTTIRACGTDTGTVDMIINAVDSDDPTAPTDATDADGRARTTANASWSAASFTNNIFYTTPDYASVIQEIADSYDYVTSGKAICIFVETNGDQTDDRRHDTYDQSTADCATLDIVYTVAAAGAGAIMTTNKGFW